LFGVNIGFWVNIRKFNNKKTIIFSVVLSLFIFIISLIGLYLYDDLKFLNDYLDIIFLVISIFLFLIIFLFILNYKNNKISQKPLFVNILFLIATIFIFNTQLDNIIYLNILLSVLTLFIIILLSFNIFKLLIYAKRPFPILIGEYMILESIIFFLFALTFRSLKDLDYGMFHPFLILTPTYQLIIILIGFCVLLLLGSYYNDKKMKNKFN